METETTLTHPLPPPPPPPPPPFIRPKWWWTSPSGLTRFRRRDSQEIRPAIARRGSRGRDVNMVRIVDAGILMDIDTRGLDVNCWG